MPQEEKKLKIKNLDNNNSFTVIFNPTEYTFEEGSKWKDQERNRQKSELQYTGGERKKLTMELFFDTYEEKQDVRQRTGKIASLLVPSIDTGNGKRPPIVELIWGQADPDPSNGIFPFKCVLEKLTQKFVLFNSDGVPVRARLNVTFKEYSLPEEELQRNPQRGSFPVQTYTVKTGDTLSSIANTFWKKPGDWRRIAVSNQISNPRILRSGEIIIIPEIE